MYKAILEGLLFVVCDDGLNIYFIFIFLVIDEYVVINIILDL